MRRLRRLLGRREQITLAVVAALVVLIGVDAGLRVRDARREAKAALVLLDRSRATLGPLLRFDTAVWPGREGYARLQEDLRGAERHLRRTDRRLGYLQWFAVAGWVIPRYGETVRNGPALLDFTTTVTAEAAGVLAQAEPLFVGTGTSGDRARAVFVDRHEALDGHLGRLDDVRDDAERLAGVGWAGPAKRAGTLLLELNEDLGRVGSVRGTAKRMAVGLDPLLGYGGPRTYIVLGQNEQELRPTGGFLGTMGVVKVADGKFASFEYASAYEYDPKPDKYRTPPPDFALGNGVRFYYVRDANWSPSFPESAGEVLRFFREDQAVHADGVVAVDTEMLRLLLQALGPMTVEGVDVPLTAENFYSALEEEIFGDESAVVAKKRTILGRVLKQSIDRMQAADADKVPALVAVLRQGVAGRHLQLFGRDERVQAVSEGFGADGTMRPRAGRDFVAVVDANVSYSKIAAAISRETTYLRRADGRVDVFVSWRNDLTEFAGQRAYVEDLPLLGTQPYDASKVAAEAVIRSYSQVYGVPVATLRCANTYGPGDLNWSRLIPGALRAALRGETLEIRSDGTPRRDYMHVDDVVTAYLLMAARFDELALAGETFNAGTGLATSVLELVGEIDLACRTAEVGTLRTRVVGTARHEIPFQVLDASKIRTRLGWAPSIMLGDGLTRTLPWYREVLR